MTDELVTLTNTESHRDSPIQVRLRLTISKDGRRLDQTDLELLKKGTNYTVLRRDREMEKRSNSNSI